MSETPTYLPQLCQRCQSLIVHGVGFKPSDSWQALLVIGNLALFQACSRDERVHQRCGKSEDGKHDTSALSLVLAELGCLGCFKPKTRQAFIEGVRRDGLSAAAQRVKTVPFDDHDAPPG